MGAQLLCDNQYGFRKKRSTQDAILHFLSTVYDALNLNKVPVGICYDFSRAFDSINHPRLIGKLKSVGVQGAHLQWFESYLRERPLHFAHRSSEGKDYFCGTPISNNIGVPQGSILGPLLFLVYINDLISALPTDVNGILFADDSNAAFSVDDSEQVCGRVEEVNSSVSSWANSNGLTLNNNKTAILIFAPRTDIKVDVPEPFRTSQSAKFLGIHIDNNPNFFIQVEEVCKKLRSAVFCLKSIRDWADLCLLKSTYHAVFESFLRYGVLAWGFLPKFQVLRIVRLQKWAIRTMTRKGRLHSCRNLFPDLNIMTFPGIYITEAVCWAHMKMLQGDIIRTSSNNVYSLRNSSDLVTERARLKKVEQSIKFSSVKFFNALPQHLKEDINPKSFRQKVTQLFLKKALYSFDEDF